ncbi:hypothetical protein J1614_000085 [Plenodomus biglobosus]|nr:hypothetical protein J1614_000085 [Plenodomus biglobosus]
MLFIAYLLLLFLLSLTVVAKDHEDFTNQYSKGLQVPVGAAISPWTHEPECDHTGTTDFCLYTNASFSHGRGISIIANRKTVANIDWLELFTKSAKIDRINPKEDLPYHEVAIPGKGMGLVAHRTILAGEPIAIWTPLFVEHETATTSLSVVDLLRLRGLAIKRLSEKSQKLFLAQHRQWGGHQVADIVATNAFMFADFGGLGGENSATFPEISVSSNATWK